MASAATDAMMPNASSVIVPNTHTTSTSVVSQPGHPCRRNADATGDTAITMINARNAGAISQAAACTPANTTTAAAAHQDHERPRQADHPTAAGPGVR